MTYSELKEWLKATGITRQMIADRFAISKGTVNNWLCGTRPIPARKLALIKDLKPYAPEAPDAPRASRGRAIGVPLTDAEYAEVLSAVISSGKRIEEFAAEAVVAAARAELGREPETTNETQETK